MRYDEEGEVVPLTPAERADAARRVFQKAVRVTIARERAERRKARHAGGGAEAEAPRRMAAASGSESDQPASPEGGADGGFVDVVNFALAKEEFEREKAFLSIYR